MSSGAAGYCGTLLASKLGIKGGFEVRVATEVTEDTVRELALPIGFADVKACAVTEVWSGLKHVVRKELR